MPRSHRRCSSGPSTSGSIIAICAIGLSHLDPANFAGSSLGGGLALDAGLLQLVFGVVLVAYFGHTSAGNAAKLILREDMTGRALLGGNVAAMATVIGLYCLGVLAINGAVGADALSGTTGTSITPLAEVAGPSVLVLGAVYVTLGLGEIGSVYGSLGLANQIREWLPSSDAGATGAPRGILRLRHRTHAAGAWSRSRRWASRSSLWRPSSPPERLTSPPRCPSSER